MRVASQHTPSGVVASGNGDLRQRVRPPSVGMTKSDASRRGQVIELVQLRDLSARFHQHLLGGFRLRQVRNGRSHNGIEDVALGFGQLRLFLLSTKKRKTEFVHFFTPYRKSTIGNRQSKIGNS